mgnify:CR=1 FL=1
MLYSYPTQEGEKFSVIDETVKNKGFRGLLHELWSVNHGENIAKIIRNARRDANLTQLELAEKIGISEKHMSKIETGKSFLHLILF